MNLGITSFFTDFAAVRWLAIFTVPIIIAWIFAVRYSGRAFAWRREE